MRSEVSVATVEEKATPEAVMAWARRSADGSVIHVSMLTREQTGQACGCICEGCGAPLQAVNAGKGREHFERPGAHRMSFRHQPGMQRSDCAVKASRAALIAAWIHSGAIGLPARCVRSHLAGASGCLHPGAASRAAEQARILASHWVDSHSAMLTLEGGRQVLVTLKADVTLDQGIHAVLNVDTDDPEVASMSLDEVLSQATLLVDQACWVRHWEDPALEAEALQDAQAWAAERMDALPEPGQFGDDPFAEPEFLQGLTPEQRGETLLHLHLKSILSRIEVLDVPACRYPVSYTPPGGGRTLEGFAHIPATRLLLSNAHLERRLGDIVPDVICDAQVEGSLLGGWPLLIEVAVTHLVGPEKLGRIQARMLACLELNAKRLAGGEALTVQQLELALQAPSAEALYWVFHETLPALIEAERGRLAAEFVEQQRRYAESRAHNERIAREIDERADAERRAQAESSRLDWRLRKLQPGDLMRLYMKELAAQPRGAAWADRRHDVFATRLRLCGYESFASAAFQPALHVLQAIEAARRTRHGNDVTQVLGMLEDGLTDKAVQPYMPVLLAVARVKLLELMVDDERQALNALRKQVWDDIERASPTFTRSLKNDGALAALYPELEKQLRPDAPGTTGYFSRLRFRRDIASGQVDLPQFGGPLPEDMPRPREPMPPHQVEAALGPARGRVWTFGGKVPFEQWSRYPDVAKLPSFQRHVIEQAYWAREQGQSVADFVRSQQPKDEMATRHFLDILASVYLLG